MRQQQEEESASDVAVNVSVELSPTLPMVGLNYGVSEVGKGQNLIKAEIYGPVKAHHIY